MVEMIALRGHVTTAGAMVMAGQRFEVAEDEANRYRVNHPHLAVLAPSSSDAPEPRRTRAKAKR